MTVAKASGSGARGGVHRARRDDQAGRLIGAEATSKVPILQVERARAVRVESALGPYFSKLKQIKNSPEYVGPCPRCGGDDRFSINTKKQAWHCRVCKPSKSIIKGDVIGLIQFLDGCDFVEAVKRLTNTTSLSGE